MEKELLNEIIIRGNRRMTEYDLTLLDESARKIGAKTIVETGSMDGCSSMVFGRIAKDNGGMLYAIEPSPKQRWYGNIKEMQLESNVTLIQAASPWLPWHKLPCTIDFLLIDGDHRCSRAITDYVALARFVVKGGLIAFHDIDGGKGVASHIREAVAICERDDNLNSEQGADYLISQYARTPIGHDRGTIIFIKNSEHRILNTEI